MMRKTLFITVIALVLVQAIALEAGASACVLSNNAPAGSLNIPAWYDPTEYIFSPNIYSKIYLINNMYMIFNNYDSYLSTQITKPRIALPDNVIFTLETASTAKITVGYASFTLTIEDTINTALTDSVSQLAGGTYTSTSNGLEWNTPYISVASLGNLLFIAGGYKYLVNTTVAPGTIHFMQYAPSLTIAVMKYEYNYFDNASELPAPRLVPVKSVTLPGFIYLPENMNITSYAGQMTELVAVYPLAITPTLNNTVVLSVAKIIAFNSSTSVETFALIRTVLDSSLNVSSNTVLVFDPSRNTTYNISVLNARLDDYSQNAYGTVYNDFDKNSFTYYNIAFKAQLEISDNGTIANKTVGVIYYVNGDKAIAFPDANAPIYNAFLDTGGGTTYLLYATRMNNNATLVVVNATSGDYILYKASEAQINQTIAGLNETYVAGSSKIVLVPVTLYNITSSTIEKYGYIVLLTATTSDRKLVVFSYNHSQPTTANALKIASAFHPGSYTIVQYTSNIAGSYQTIIPLTYDNIGVDFGFAGEPYYVFLSDYESGHTIIHELLSATWNTSTLQLSSTLYTPSQLDGYNGYLVDSINNGYVVGENTSSIVGIVTVPISGALSDVYTPLANAYLNESVLYYNNYFYYFVNITLNTTSIKSYFITNTTLLTVNATIVANDIAFTLANLSVSYSYYNNVSDAKPKFLSYSMITNMWLVSGSIGFEWNKTLFIGSLSSMYIDAIVNTTTQPLGTDYSPGNVSAFTSRTGKEYVYVYNASLLVFPAKLYYYNPTANAYEIVYYTPTLQSCGLYQIPMVNPNDTSAFLSALTIRYIPPSQATTTSGSQLFQIQNANITLPPAPQVPNPSLTTAKGIVSVLFFLALYVYFNQFMIHSKAVVASAALSMVLTIVLFGVNYIGLITIIIATAIALGRTFGK